MTKAFVVETITRLLTEHGELTGEEIIEESGLDPRIVYNALVRMRKSRKYGKRAYIKRYSYESCVGRRFYPRAVYALGSKADAAKPNPNLPAHQRSIRKRSEDRRAVKVNSVFMLGASKWKRIYRRREALEYATTGDQTPS